MGGPKIEWRPGRSDYADDTRYPGRGRLPDGAQGSDHLRAVFTDALGFNDQVRASPQTSHACCVLIATVSVRRRSSRSLVRMPLVAATPTGQASTGHGS